MLKAYASPETHQCNINILSNRTNVRIKEQLEMYLKDCIEWIM